MKKQKEVVHSKFEQYKIKKEDYLKYLKENTKEQYEIDKKEWEAYNSKLHSLETLIQSLSYLEKEEKPDIQKLKVELDQIFKEAENQIQIHHEMERIVKQNENVFYQLKENHQKRNEVISLQMRYEKLYRKLSGTMSKDAKMDIETFVQRYYLKLYKAEKTHPLFLLNSDRSDLNSELPFHNSIFLFLSDCILLPKTDNL